MNPSYNKAKGRSAENRFVEYLKTWWPLAERRRLTGAKDRGDVTGVPRTVIEVKSGASITLPQWLKELDAEMINDNADYGFVAIKPKGKTQGDDYFIVTRPDIMIKLLNKALNHYNCECCTVEP